MSDFKPSQWAMASAPKQGRAPGCCTTHRTPNQQTAGPGGDILVFWPADLHACPQRFVQSFTTQRFKHKEENPDRRCEAPPLAMFPFEIWIWLMGPSPGVWVNVQMDKTSHSGTVKAGFYHSGFLSSTWVFCQVTFAPKVTFQTDLYCDVLYTLRT